jgi:hypothetical protein
MKNFTLYIGLTCLLVACTSQEKKIEKAFFQQFKAAMTINHFRDTIPIYQLRSRDKDFSLYFINDVFKYNGKLYDYYHFFENKPVDFIYQMIGKPSKVSLTTMEYYLNEACITGKKPPGCCCVHFEVDNTTSKVKKVYFDLIIKDSVP